MADKIRFTISVEPEVHEAFQAMAEASGQSLSRVVGGWLKDTTQAARFVSGELQQMRNRPVEVLQQLASVQDRAALQTRDLVAGLQSGKLRITGLDVGKVKGERVPGGPAEPAGRRSPPPPSSLTGVKDPKRAGRKP
jgi:hypothetical protein